LSDNELLLALSDMMEKKLNAQLEPMKKDITDIKNEVQKLNVILENEIRPDIKLLAENYLPAAIRYEKSNKEHEAIKNDIDLLKKVVTEHSEKLQKIS
jgi:hypothetical protein